VTLVELVLAVFLAVLVAIAAGFIYLTNQRSFRQGREKLLVQQNASWCLEEMARDLRQARRVDPVNEEMIVLYDVQGLVFSTWERGSDGGESRLLRNGAAAAPEECTVLRFTVLTPDTSAVGVDLELRDAADNQVRVENKVALRNHEIAAP
jgi:hypothetical protein